MQPMKKGPAGSITDAEMQSLCDYIENISSAQILNTLYTTIVNNAGGVQNMDPRMVTAFARSFAKFKDAGMTESIYRRENTMRLTKRQLRQIIKEEKEKILTEMNPDGTISYDEDFQEDQLMEYAVMQIIGLTNFVRTKAAEIGGDARAPAIKQRVFRAMKSNIPRR